MFERSMSNIEIRENRWILWAENYVKVQEVDSVDLIASYKLVDSWSKRLPDLDNEWTHWWIEGEGYCLGVISSDEHSKAKDLIVKNWQRFLSIYAYRARMDANGDPIKQLSCRTEISNYKNDLNDCKPQ